MNSTGTGSKAGTFIIIIVLVAAIVLGAVSCGGSGSGGGSKSTNTCKSCGRTYEAGDSGGNYMSIAKTGMCKNCYENFKWGQQFIGR